MSWRNWINEGWLPQRCLACAEQATTGALCAECRAALPRNDCACPRCALPIPHPAPLCGACIKRAPPQSRALAPLCYAEPVDHLLTAFKFSQRLAAGRLLSQLMSAAAQEAALLDGLTLAVPVPLHRQRLRERGYNQSLELLRPLLRGRDMRLDHRAIARQRATPPQTGLNALQRRRNLHGAFVAQAERVSGQRILLVDDVITTGATMAEAARTLLKAGALEVRLLAVARVARPWSLGGRNLG